MTLTCITASLFQFLTFSALGMQADVKTFTFSDVQADRGKAAYVSHCASCHGARLDDGQFGPPLKGPSFEKNWAGKPVASLFQYISTKMPPVALGGLGAETYASLIAYLARANGAIAATSPLPSDEQSGLALLSPATSAASPASSLNADAASDKLASIAKEVAGEFSAVPSGPVEIPAILQKMSPVTDSTLRSPPAGDWLSWRRTYDGQGFSPLLQINRKNVRRLGLAWAWTLPPGPLESTPLIHDGVLFIQSGADVIQALDGKTGDLLWQYTRELPPNVDNGIDMAYLKRNMAIFGNTILAATADLHVIALDAKTGKSIWDREIADYRQYWRLTSGPLIADGKVIQGVSGAAGYQAGGAFIVALDAKTGEPLWRFNTIAHPNELGGNSWNDLPIAARSGGSIWTAGTFDSKTGLLFFGPAPTYDTAPLLHKIARDGVTNDALFTNATIALNVHDGRLVWYFQHVPNDQWDLDWSFERTLVTLDEGHGPRTYAITGGKEALFDTLDAATGKYVFSYDFGLQNVIVAVDPASGAKAINPDVMLGDGKEHLVCPNAFGGRNWMATSLDPASKVLYVPLNETCMRMIPAPEGAHTLLTTGMKVKPVPRANSDGRVGRLAAFDVQRRRLMWSKRTRAPQTSAVLATAGGLVFNATDDRWFMANDAATGALLWKARLNDVPGAFPVSYEVTGIQYIALAVGGGGPVVNAWPIYVPEVRNPSPSGPTLWVFALEGGPSTH